MTQKKNSTSGHEGKPATKRKALFRATLGLEEHKLIVLTGNYVWLPVA